MYNSSYPKQKNTLFSYADGYCSVFPRGLEKYFKIGDGYLVIEDDYIVVVKNGTPNDIKQQFLKDYAEYYQKKKYEQTLGFYND